MNRAQGVDDEYDQEMVHKNKDAPGAPHRVESEGLREQALERLRAGNAPATRGTTVGPEALHLLHELASNPETAGDALKLLHELQTYQVELDLQHVELEEQQHALEYDVTRYRALFERAPVAYVLLDPAGCIVEANRAAIELLGLPMEGVAGELLQDYLAREDHERLAPLLSGGHAACDVRLAKAAGGTQWLRLLPGDGAEELEGIPLALVARDIASAVR